MAIFFGPKEVKKFLEINKVHKSLGQNFLIDKNVCTKIADFSSYEKGYVIEIGPGLGNLTQFLAKKFEKVITIEIDFRFIPILNKNLKKFNNIKIVNSDALKIDLFDLISKFSNQAKKTSICANLPYSIATLLIIKLLELPVSRITVMIQKELAFRLLSPPGAKLCGAISVPVWFYSTPKLIFNVSRNCFLPIPNVDSCVVSFELNKIENIENKEFLFKISRISFLHRRKTVFNSLSKGLNIPKSKIICALNYLNLDENIRPENLTLSNFLDLSHLLGNFL
ncbi:MAG: 16S rRNA (adenine(1518)-N(6)/adenine(1519)-N(6))-dimethyltransferase RsmA [Oscillospiraceae bacterium]|jgi:16S rRNA (adenine1518-N6/adenine1519-N6)-dimethyltransferase|nr:16S rRNA (adenine(1518)-N(6)/adenine(1519)-N(6))-dimethyltransferase RsmA [Oscillospiraceae bacterium]